MRKKLKKIFKINLYIIISLAFLPPIYLIPNNNLLTTHNLARILIILNLLIYTLIKKKEKKKNILIFLITLYIITQSFSILKTVNIIAFIYYYKNIIFGPLLFYTMLNVSFNKGDIHFIIKLLIFLFFLNAFFKFLIYFYPNFTYNFIFPIIYQKYTWFINFQANRGRYFSETFDEIFLPLIIFRLISNSNTFKNFFYFYLISITIFFIFLSNWRYKVIVLLLNTIATSYLLFKAQKRDRKKKLITSPFLFTLLGINLIVIIVAVIISQKISGYNIIQRFIQPEKNDISSIQARITFWKEAILLTQKSPILGIGLGNYFDYSKEIKNKTYNFYEKFNPAETPHNIFINTIVSTGILGFLTLFSIILYFLKHDLSFLKKKYNSEKTYLIICFWSLFLYSLTNPSDYFTYQFFFWFLRGLIHIYETS